ncbi:MAG: hypothetical protein HC914_21185 [Chloroflexaceae bacterium]|nr:hypothetical protein [Chloroflexaceae bacterium]
MFRRLTEEVYAREQSLKQQLRALQIEIDRTRVRYETEKILQTNYFQELRQNAQALRDELNEG